jgi:hypothetical protein
VVESYEHNNEPEVSMKNEEFLTSGANISFSRMIAPCRVGTSESSSPTHAGTRSVNQSNSLHATVTQGKGRRRNILTWFVFWDVQATEEQEETTAQAAEAVRELRHRLTNRTTSEDACFM